ncbi:MAG: hypothetical protein MZV65_52105 [Chromatiales bacterium]|nr:hypothetical protein [Chromatiales bacterium]
MASRPTSPAQPAAGDEFTLSPSVNQDIFTTVQNLANVLEIAGHTARRQFHNAMNRVLMDLDQGMEQHRTRSGRAPAAA